ncbi:MAG: hypothetical protein Q7R70_05960 [Candidatus Diapherotrites archaeon]|nr:hypothetical protein [Candidatus Diapherotrites archaeon]
MPELSDCQKGIAKLLAQSPKTAEEIAAELKLSYLKTMEELKEMLKTELIVKEGFPTKYSLAQQIVQKVKERRKIEEKDLFKIRLNCMIEIKAIEAELLKKSINEIEEALKTDQAFTIYDIRKAEPMLDGEYYSSFLEVNLSIRDFKAITHLMFYYAPAAIEVLKPDKIELTQDDLQDALVDMSELIHAYADQITKLMNRKEMEDFTRKLYGK